MLPEVNELPSTTYEAKNVVGPPNDCILYSGDEYENLDACLVCDAKWNKIKQNDPGDVDGEPAKKKFPLR